MYVLNLGLHGVAVARDEFLRHTFENDFKKCNEMGALMLDAVEHAPTTKMMNVNDVNALSDEQMQEEEEHYEMMQPHFDED